MTAEKQPMAEGPVGRSEVGKGDGQQRSPSENVLVAIIAAGESRRMGTCKLLLPFEGRTLLERAVETALDADVGEVVVITGPYHDKMAPLLAPLPVTVLLNEHWREGQSTSVVLAAKRAQEQRSDALVVMVADQPFLTAEHLQALVEKWREAARITDGGLCFGPVDGSISVDDGEQALRPGSAERRKAAGEPIGAPIGETRTEGDSVVLGTPLVMTTDGVRRGNPCAFDRQWFDLLQQLRGDEGARALVRRFPERVELVQMPDKRLFMDVDTPQDYARLMAMADGLPFEDFK